MIAIAYPAEQATGSKMSLRLEMLQVARLAPTVLGTDATALIRDFTLAKKNPDGGFQDRGGKSDLYYTSFAVDILTALQTELPEGLGAFLETRDPGTLDFVHLCCLARLASTISSRGWVTDVLSEIESYRTGDGGYNQTPDADTGSAYACLLAFGAYADHRLSPPDADGIADCLGSLTNPDGSFANDHQLPIGNSPATAAAITLSRSLRLPLARSTPEFLLSCLHPDSGGFLPFPGAPLPDLLCTAVSIHALDGLQVPLGTFRENTLDFIDTLWTAEGGFFGNWEDDSLDLEYTYYGLLALGHLAF